MEAAGQTSRVFSCCSVTPHAGIVFPAVTHVRALISERSRQQDFTNIPVVVDCDHLVNIDYTAAAQLSDMMAEFASRQQPIFWLRPDSRVANTVRAVAGDLFVTITGAHQVMEDQRDGKVEVEVEVEEPQEEKKETDSLVEVQTEQ